MSKNSWPNKSFLRGMRLLLRWSAEAEIAYGMGYISLVKPNTRRDRGYYRWRSRKMSGYWLITTIGIGLGESLHSDH